MIRVSEDVIVHVLVAKRVSRETWKLSCSCGKCEILKGIANAESRLPEYSVWRAMKERCLNRRNARYKSYGGRGILVCEAWKESFQNFINDMGRRPSCHHSIERRNNNGNYDPDNCYWATRPQQQRNRRNTVRVRFRGRTMSVTEACEIVGTPRMRAYAHICAGWNPLRAITAPAGSKRKAV